MRGCSQQDSGCTVGHSSSIPFCPDGVSFRDRAYVAERRNKALKRCVVPCLGRRERPHYGRGLFPPITMLQDVVREHIAPWDKGVRITTIRTALISSAVAALISWADHSGSAKAMRYIAFQTNSNSSTGNICTGYRSPNAAVAPRPASRANRTPWVAANSFVWRMTAGQIYTPRPAAITRYTTRNVYRRKSETSSMLVRDASSLDGTDDPTSEFMVAHCNTVQHKRRVRTCMRQGVARASVCWGAFGKMVLVESIQEVLGYVDHLEPQRSSPQTHACLECAASVAAHRLR